MIRGDIDQEKTEGSAAPTESRVATAAAVDEWWDR